MLLDELRQNIIVSDVDRPDPREVVEAGVPEPYRCGVYAEPAREQELESDRDVAQAHGAVPVVEQGAGHDPHRVGEVDDPRLRCCAAPHLVCDVEHHRNRAKRFRKASRTGRLLAHAPTPQRNGLIEVSSSLTTDAQLQQDEIGTVHRLVEIGRGREGAPPPMTAGNPSAHTGDRIEARRVGIAENEFVNIERLAQAGDPVDQLGCVGAAASDHRDLHAPIMALIESLRRRSD